jgi:hypothetical protein
MSNVAIGEVNLSVGGREFTLRPSFYGLAEIESRANCDVLNIAKEIHNGKIKLTHIVAIFYGGIVGATPRGQKPEISFDELGDLVVKNNYASIVQPIIEFFRNAVLGDPEATEKKTQ